MLRNTAQGFDNFDRVVVGLMFLFLCLIIFATAAHLEYRIVNLKNQFILEHQELIQNEFSEASLGYEEAAPLP